MRRGNLYAADFVYDDEDPAGYQSAVARVGDLAGGRELAVKLFELPAGEALCPYHYEYVEEWLVVLDGSLVVRVPDGEEELERGDVVCFPAGPPGAHKVINRSERTVHALMFSAVGTPGVSVYPDSDKIGVWTGNPDDDVLLRRADGNVDYWQGEP